MHTMQVVALLADVKYMHHAAKVKGSVNYLRRSRTGSCHIKQAPDCMMPFGARHMHVKRLASPPLQV